MRYSTRVYEFDRYNIYAGCVSKVWEKSFKDTFGVDFCTLLENDALPEGTFKNDDGKITEIEITDEAIRVGFNFNPETTKRVSIRS